MNGFVGGNGRPEKRIEKAGRKEGPNELTTQIGRKLGRSHAATNDHGQTDRRVKVSAGEMAGGIDRQGDPDASDGRHLKKPGMGGKQDGGSHRTAAEEDQDTGADGLAGKVMDSIHFLCTLYRT